MVSRVTQELSALTFRRQPIPVGTNVDPVQPVILEMVHSVQVSVTVTKWHENLTFTFRAGPYKFISVKRCYVLSSLNKDSATTTPTTTTTAAAAAAAAATTTTTTTTTPTTTTTAAAAAAAATTTSTATTTP